VVGITQEEKKIELSTPERELPTWHEDMFVSPDALAASESAEMAKP
jgi:hypothetical protein